MSEHTLYLRNGLVHGQTLRPELQPGALRVARRWLGEGVDPASIEISGELLARLAEQLGEGSLARDRVLESLEAQAAVPELTELLRVALPESATVVVLAAAAVHVLDIAEHMALEIYVAELPSLLARADRSGDAARKAGIARHLRG